MEKIKWHRLFGLTLTDLLTDSAYQVELEKEVSLKKQFLDVVIVRKTADGKTVELPVGFENLDPFARLVAAVLGEEAARGYDYLFSRSVGQNIGGYGRRKNDLRQPSFPIVGVVLPEWITRRSGCPPRCSWCGAGRSDPARRSDRGSAA